MAGFILGPEKEANCCYYETVGAFIEEKYSPKEWAVNMKTSLGYVYRMEVGRAQMTSWEECYVVCKQQLKELDPRFRNMNIIFEFGMKEYHDKRPDVVFVSDNYVLIAEFKRKDTGLKADIDQAAKYGVKLADGHLGSRDKKVFRMLVDTQAEKGTWDVINDRKLLRVSADMFGRGIERFFRDRDINNSLSIVDWMNEDFLERPDVVQGTIDIFNSGNIGDVRPVLTSELQNEFERRKEYLLEKVCDAKYNHKFVLAILTGVPGAGKTYMGISFVPNYSWHVDCLQTLP